MNYNETIQYLYNRLPVFHQVGAKAYKPGLDNSIRLMESLGNPHNSYKTIHIAGTNGKGSTSHFLSAILQSAGYKVGLYTSPHLVDFRERIRVNGEKISKDYVVNFVKENESLFEEIKPSFFEATMAMAFQYFSDSEVDVAIIEVGLGGRLDELSIITNIGFDHTEFLGKSLDKIAEEKAGIIKERVPVIIGETQKETKKVFHKIAKSKNAPIVFADKVNEVSAVIFSTGEMIVKHKKLGDIQVGLGGDYQLHNVATVITVFEELEKLGFHVSFENLKKGLKDVVSMPGLLGRWQIVQENPSVILDTGHNKEGIQYVAEQLKHMKFNNLHVVFGMVDDKDIEGVLGLLPENATFYFTAAETKRAVPPEQLINFGEKFKLRGNSYKSVEEAVTEALKVAGAEDVIYIGGSNFIVGEALPLFTN